MSSTITDFYTGTIVTYIVPVTGTYDITTFGAQGGGVGNFAGGLGAEISVDVTLTAGSVLDILVGGQGAAGALNGAGGGGGGGSFVALANGSATPTLLVAAGGGGGAFNAGIAAGAGANASITTNGTSPGGGGLGNVGGSNGSGGSADGVLAGSGGGGGFTGNGQSDPNGSSAVGGLSFTGYLAGKIGPIGGGFGGGGQGAAFFGSTGGGGGGYSGGGAGGNGLSNDAGAAGGGGGSYFLPTASSVTLIGGAESGNGVIDIVLTCFLKGTRIATPRGEVAVETLRPGDLIRTADGSTVPLIWTGHRRIRASTRLDRRLHYPVRVRANAIAPGIPKRDLLVTGDHALGIDGALIPARLLVNGVSIIAEFGITAFTYYHLELARHALLLAESLPAESYLDTGNRRSFASSTLAPHPAAPPAGYGERGIAPLTLSPALVEPIWNRLALRAGLTLIPARQPASPLPCLMVNNQQIEPCLIEGERLLFILPAHAAQARLTSTATRPNDAYPWLDDRRQLGVKIRRIRQGHPTGATDIALDDPALLSGWHAIETATGQPERWTNGDGAIALTPAFLSNTPQTKTLEIWLTGQAV